MKFFSCCLAFCFSLIAQAQTTTSFTYQGMLNDGDSLATGRYDLTFSVFEASTGGIAVRSLTNATTEVRNGLFTVDLDFGASIFDGGSRWLEIGARTNGAVEAFTLLTPRQPISSTPYAIRAHSAEGVTGTVSADRISGVIPDSRLSTNVLFYNGTNLTIPSRVAIGTTNLPSNSFEVYNETRASGAEIMDQSNEAADSLRNVDGLAWQSFTAGRSGNLVRFEIECGAARGLASISIQIKKGSGTTGQSLETFSTIIENTEVSWRSFPLNSIPRVEAGEVYTIWLYTYDEVDWRQSSGNTYTNGTSVFGADLTFRTYLKPDAPEQILVVKDGRVGIRTPNPTSTLHVEGGLKASYFDVPVRMNAGSTGAPSTGLLGGPGERVSLWPGNDLEPSYAFGIDAGTLWSSVPSDASFKWYTGTTERMRLSNLGELSATSFSGSGAGLTNVSASNLAGNISDARLSTNVARLNAGIQNFTGTNTFSRVGIGLSSPETALQVAGTIYTSKGVGLPTVGKTGGTGDRLVLSDGSATATPYSLGINGLTMWFGIPGDARFEWYSHTNRIMHLASDGALYATTFNPQSDRAAKENFTEVNATEVLEKVLAMPISRWNYKTDAASEHIGPMAQDFHAAFGVGTDDKHIATVDADGVALAAIQGLNEKLEQQARQLESKNSEVERLKQELQELRRAVQSLSGQPSTESKE